MEYKWWSDMDVYINTLISNGKKENSEYWGGKESSKAGQKERQEEVSIKPKTSRLRIPSILVTAQCRQR